MRLAITGAYGSGKSTLARAAADRFGLRIDPLPAMQDPLGAPGPAIGSSAAELVELTVRRLIDRSAAENGKHIVSDGSLVHDWVFVKTLLLHGPDPDAASEPPGAVRAWVDEFLEPTRRAIRSRLAAQYDVVVHLPIEFALTEKQPPITESFRHRSDHYLLAELAAAGIRSHVVRGSVADRLDRLGVLLDASHDASPVRPDALASF